MLSALIQSRHNNNNRVEYYSHSNISIRFDNSITQRCLSIRIHSPISTSLYDIQFVSEFHLILLSLAFRTDALPTESESENECIRTVMIGSYIFFFFFRKPSDAHLRHSMLRVLCWSGIESNNKWRQDQANVRPKNGTSKKQKKNKPSRQKKTEYDDDDYTSTSDEKQNLYHTH